jgi:hypothetical protein
MTSAISKIRKIRDRRKPINTNLNAQIKHLQVKLVELSFTKGDHTQEYFQTLGKIKALRLLGLGK